MTDLTPAEVIGRWLADWAAHEPTPPLLDALAAAGYRVVKDEPAQVIQGEMMTWTPEPWVTYDEDGKRWRVLNPHCSWPSLIAEATDD